LCSSADFLIVKDDHLPISGQLGIEFDAIRALVQSQLKGC